MSSASDSSLSSHHQVAMVYSGMTPDSLSYWKKDLLFTGMFGLLLSLDNLSTVPFTG